MSRAVIYKDEIIKVFSDLDNCFIYFISFTGKVRVVNFDSNFYSAQSDYDTYCGLLNDMVADNDISEQDYSKYEKRFSKWLKRQVKGTSDEDSIDFDKPQYEKRINDKELLNDLLERLTLDYNGDVAFSQHEEDRLIIRHIIDGGLI